jgi:hypothetical protein
MAEDNWLITSLIVIVMVILIVSIISFLVVAFQGQTFFEAVCPASPVGTTATATTKASAKEGPRITPTVDPNTVAETNRIAMENENDNRIVQVLYIDGKAVATQTRTLAPATAPIPLLPDSDPAVVSEPEPTPPITTFDPASTKPTPSSIKVQETEIDPLSIAQMDATVRKNARHARTKSRQRASGPAALFDQTTDTLTPAQAAAVTTLIRARAADSAALLAAEQLKAAGQPVPPHSSVESALPLSVKEMALNAAIPLPPPISAQGPLSGSIISAARRIRQILRLVDVTLVSGANEGITLGADVLCVAMVDQQLQPRILVTSRSGDAAAGIPSPWPALSDLLDPAASSTDKPNIKPTPRGQIIWRGESLTIKNGLQPVRVQSTLIRPIDSSWTANWTLRLELVDPLTGDSLAGSCARIT